MPFFKRHEDIRVDNLDCARSCFPRKRLTLTSNKERL